MKKQEIIDLFERHRNNQNSSTIDSIISKINSGEFTEEEREAHLNKLLKDQKIVDESGDINEYMLERYIIVNMDSEKKSSEYEKQNGEGSSKRAFQHQNGLVLLENTVNDAPIELHIKSSIPDILKNNDRTRLTPNGNRILQLAFCDALLKVRKKWIEAPINLQNADELRLVSFMINKKTAEFLQQIGFNAQSVKLNKTDYKNGPEIEKGNLTDEEYEEISQRLKPYLYRYSVHKDSNENITPTTQIGIAEMSKEKLMSNEEVKKILGKREMIIDELKSKNIDIKQVDSELVSLIPDIQKMKSTSEFSIVLDEENFITYYGFSYEQGMQIQNMQGDEVLKRDGILIFAGEEKVEMQHEDAFKALNDLCKTRDIDPKTINEN